ncbi:uncharacterized protein DFL_002860 [Arthrobotrys flagrans]|uniref:Uncharacterized protein n=1 Tax=Arthrobotrys flagrans TaxID=97331 RepID=A0A437ABN8_ARTFL|nr:hypothetical protein DFL_002860 [Arthrobotrys flagrans]
MSDEEEPLTPSLMFRRLQSRISHNLSGTFGNLSGTDYIRLVAIVGGYLLLRPYLQKIGAKYQERDHARTVDENEQDSMAATGQKARVIAGEGYDLDDDESSDEEGWGRKKRLQQRKERARKKKEIEDRIKAEEDEEDKDIQEFLHD